MFDRIRVGSLYRTYEHAGDAYSYSKVIITVSDDLSYEAGTDTGRTLRLDCPWGTQKMATDILARIRGIQHRGYTATDVILDPAAELGDAIDINGNQGGLYRLRHKFGGLMVADIGSPGVEEIDDEVPYKSATERKIERTYAEAKATFQVQASQIAAEVSAREAQGRELRASLNIQADRISQEVSAREAQGEQFKAQFQVQANQISSKVAKTGGNGSSFEWAHDDNKIIYKSNGSEVFRIDASGAKVTGEIRATSGKIGGFSIMSDYLSYNGQTWGGTNTKGIYIGTQGIQIGKNFRLDNAGNLHAKSGTFDGTVQAGNIDYGGDAGYFSGSGLSGGSVYGSKIAGSTLGTSKFTGGVNTSLANADYSYDAVAHGAEIVNIGAYMFYFGGSAVRKSSVTIDGTQIHYLSWNNRG